MTRPQSQQKTEETLITPRVPNRVSYTSVMSSSFIGEKDMSKSNSQVGLTPALGKEDVYVACIVGDAWKRAEEIKKDK